MCLRATPEKKEEKERVRLSLCQATLRLAAAHGFSSLGLREVSREAGIAPTSFYRHFADMGDLGLSLIHDLVEPLMKELSESLEGAASRSEDVPGALVAQMVRAVEQDAELVRFIVAESNGGFASFRSALRAQLVGLAKVLQQTVGPQVPLSAAEACLVLLWDAALRLLDTETQARQALTEQLTVTLRHLLTQPGTKEESP